MKFTEGERLHNFTRRALILAGIKAGLLFGLLSKLYYLQIIKADHYRTIADNNRISLQPVIPPRGTILDRNGTLLADNKHNFRAYIMTGKTKDTEESLRKFSEIIPLTQDELDRVLTQLSRRRFFSPVTIRNNLTWEEVSAIELNSLKFPGIFVERWEARHYPMEHNFAHVVGYVGLPSDDEILTNSWLTSANINIGKTGAEKQYQKVLMGKLGANQYEINALGRVVREISKDKGAPGTEISLTIDAELQKFTQKKLSSERSASAVVMDIHSGEVHALASHPSYNPNDFVFGISSQNWKKFTDKTTAPLMNKAITGQYSPGSTFKLVSALAALENGVVDENSSVICEGHADIGNQRFYCWKSGGHGKINLRRAIAESCDVFFYKLSEKMSAKTVADTAASLGFGKTLGIDLPGEKSGIIPSSSWKTLNLTSKWQQGDTAVTMIGHGFLLATPLQLATMVARLANGGYAVSPRIIKSIGGNNALPENIAKTTEEIGFYNRHLKTIMKGMADAVAHHDGTAYTSRILEPEFEMAGKTGTSQVRKISAAERARGVTRNEDLPWRLRDHSLFVGYAPVHKPRFACAVVVEHGGNGSIAAAPIAGEVLEKCQKLLG